MTKPARPAGTIPAALSATGQDVPPSPDVAQHNLAQLIGQGVAVNLAQLLGPVLQRLVDVQERPACIVCASRVKREHLVAVANAQAAAEPEPAPGKISQSFTEGRRGPVCWDCLDPDQDGPFEYLPASEPQAVAKIKMCSCGEAPAPHYKDGRCLRDLPDDGE